MWNVSNGLQYDAMDEEGNWRNVIENVNPGCGFVATYADSRVSG